MWMRRMRRRMDEGRQRNTPKWILQGHAFDSDVALSNVLYMHFQKYPPPSLNRDLSIFSYGVVVKIVPISYGFWLLWKKLIDVDGCQSRQFHGGCLNPWCGGRWLWLRVKPPPHRQIADLRPTLRFRAPRADPAGLPPLNLKSLDYKNLKRPGSMPLCNPSHVGKDFETFNIR